MSDSSKMEGVEQQQQQQQQPPQQQQQPAESSEGPVSTVQPEQDTSDHAQQQQQLIFPNDSLVALEKSVLGLSWSIPTDPEGPFGVCLQAYEQFVAAGKDETDELCSRFVKSSMTTAFTYMLTSESVRRWNGDTLRALQVFQRKFAEIAGHKAETCGLELLNLISLVLSQQNEFATMTEQMRPTTLRNRAPESVFAEEGEFCPSGFFVDAVNLFGDNGGFDGLLSRALKPDAKMDELAICLSCMLGCGSMLSQRAYEQFFEPIAGQYLKRLREMSKKQVKEQLAVLMGQPDAFKLVREIQRTFRDDDPAQSARRVADVQLDLLLKLLAIESFNASMFALNELKRLFSSAYAAAQAAHAKHSSDQTRRIQTRTVLTNDVLGEWMETNNVFDMLFRNLHQAQYVNRLEDVVRFLIRSNRLTQDQLRRIWHAQTDQQDATVKNIHSLLTRIAWFLNSDQLDFLFICFKETWGGSKRNMEDLLHLIRQLAENDRDGLVATKVLDLLWTLAHDDSTDKDILELALNCHKKILEALSPELQDRDERRVNWFVRAVEEFVAGRWMMPAMQMMMDILLTLEDVAEEDQNPYSREHVIEMVKQHANQSLEEVATRQLKQYCDRATPLFAAGKEPGQVFVFPRYTYIAGVRRFLKFIRFIVYEARVWFAEATVKNVWDLLVTNKRCDADRTVCLEWFANNMEDVQDEHYPMLLAMLRTIPLDQFDMHAWRCFARCFMKLNNIEKRTAVLHSLDLPGFDFIWTIALESPQDQVASAAVTMLQRLYSLYTQEGGPDLTHLRFMKDCFEHIKKGSNVDGNSLHSERSLRLLKTYVSNLDGAFHCKREHIPHNRAYVGEVRQLFVHHPRLRRSETVPAHDTMTLGELRQRIGHAFRIHFSRVGISCGEALLTTDKDNTALRDLDLDLSRTVTARTLADTAASRWSPMPDPDIEARLPSVLLSHSSEYMDVLFKLAGGAPGPVCELARSLLESLPSDPRSLTSLSTALSDLEDTKLRQFLSDFLGISGFRRLYNLRLLRQMLQPVQSNDDDLTLRERRKAFRKDCPADVLLDVVTACSSRLSSPEAIVFDEAVDTMSSCLSLLDGLVGDDSSQSSPASAEASPSAPTDDGELPRMHDILPQLAPLLLRVSVDTARSADIVKLPGRLQQSLSALLVKHLSLLRKCVENSEELRTDIFANNVNDATISALLLDCPFSPVRQAFAQLFKVAPSERLGPVAATLLSLRKLSESKPDTCGEFFAVLSWTLAESKGDGLELKQLSDEEMVILLDAAKRHAEGKPVHDTLLAGHCQLMAALATVVEPTTEAGSRLIEAILKSFLFPASFIRAQCRAGQPLEANEQLYRPACTSKVSREHAYELLSRLCRISHKLFDSAIRLLGQLHYNEQDKLPKFEFWPETTERPEHGYCGLKNAAATCYMNSIIQQMYNQPDVRRRILGIHLPIPSNDTAASQGDDGQQQPPSGLDETDLQRRLLLQQFQIMMAHLHKYDGKYFTPSGIWNTYRHWGEPVNVAEQQDAQEFFTNIIDQIDEAMKKLGLPEVMCKTFGGSFADQKIIQSGCDHRYEREESFVTIPVAVQNFGTLEESLHNFVNGEVLKGDNAYKCEKCDEKRDTMKRMCIKNLPNTLAIHLKRFDYDWERGIPVKSNDYLEFPQELDMAPYTLDGLTAKEQIEKGEKVEMPQHLYRLVGVTVHSGQANGGHYYSFICPREQTGTSCDKNAWYRFDDTDVSLYHVTPEGCTNDWYGGSHLVEVFDKVSRRYVSRRKDRWWNGYMLFYERVATSSEREPSPMDSDAQLCSSLAELVKHNNMEFHHNCTLFEPAYFQFLCKLAHDRANDILKARVQLPAEADTGDLDSYAQQLADLGIVHLSWYGLKIDSLYRPSIADWSKTFEVLFATSTAAIARVLKSLEHPESGFNCVTMLQCPDPESREVLRRVIEECLVHAIKITGLEKMKPKIAAILSPAIMELAKCETNYVRTAPDFFKLLLFYAKLGSEYRQHLVELGVPAAVVRFYCNETVTTTHSEAYDFWTFFELMIVFAVTSDISGLQDNGQPQPNPYQPSIAVPEMKGTSGLISMDTTLIASLAKAPFFKDAELAADHYPDLWRSFVQCLAFNSKASSITMMENLASSVDRASNLHMPFHVQSLDALFAVEDCFQQKRIEISLSGTDPNIFGFFYLMKCCQDKRYIGRIYQLLRGVDLFRQNFKAKAEMDKPENARILATSFAMISREQRRLCTFDKPSEFESNTRSDISNLRNSKSLENLLEVLQPHVPQVQVEEIGPQPQAMDDNVSDDENSRDVVVSDEEAIDTNFSGQENAV